MVTLSDVLPQNVFELLNETIEDIITRQQGGLLSISIMLSIYFASRAVISLMDSFDKVLPTFRKRNFINNQLVAFKLMALLFLLLIASITLFIGGETIIRWLMKIIDVDSSSTYSWFTAIRWFTIVGLIYFSIALIYFLVLPPITDGAFFSRVHVGYIAFDSQFTLFSWTIDQFGQYNKLYGSIGTLVVFDAVAKL